MFLKKFTYLWQRQKHVWERERLEQVYLLTYGNVKNLFE